MATSINGSNQPKPLTIGLLFVFGDIISNEQRNEISSLLNKALKHIDKNKFGDIEKIFNNLIHNAEFQADSQYRQILNTDNGSLAGFLYLPNFHTVLNVLKDFFNSCYRVSIVFVGQQIDFNGALILADSFFSSDHLHNLFQENSLSITQDLQIILPFVSHQWTRLLTHYLQKHLKYVQLNDLSADFDQDNTFGQLFYEQFVDILNKETSNFDIYSKLIPRDSSGAIAFDEPNLYILYGQQGEASLFGIRGFVVLVNGGFSRIPSYWNLIRGLQNIDACILTHFDYDVLPGLQTLLHRKTIPISEDGRLCKPDIGAIFLNHTQRTRFQSSPSSKRSSTNKLTINLSQNIDQFSNDIKKLNIDTFDLIKHTKPNKSSIEPINLYKKIAFGSLDLYVLHPTSLSAEDEKVLAMVQKTPIRDQQPSSSVIPLHHWYSSCILLVWTPTSKSSKDSLVRILYTGACPQTLVFEALTRARHLDLLHESSQHQPMARINSGKPVTSANGNTTIKPSPSKSKASSPGTNNETISITKAPTRPIASKSKPVPPTTAIKSDKPRSTSAVAAPAKKATGGSPQSINSGKKNSNSRVLTSKSSASVIQVNDHDQKLETQTDEQESVQNDSEDSLQENHERKSSSDSVAYQDEEPTNDTHEYEIKRPESVSLINDTHEPFVESNTTTPIDELSSHLISTDPMTTSFVDGAPNTRNPFLEKSPNDDNKIDIVHHTVSAVHKQLMPSIDEMNPQGLPMDDDIHSKKATSKKPVDATHRSSVPTISSTHLRKPKQTSPSGPIFHVDVAYIPYHGNEHYVDSEFFRRIRARYYILNAVEISRLTLESLIDGKQQWDKQEQLPVTLVPTFDGDQLRQFFVMNKTRLAELNINILPASTRCNVQYDDDGSPAQRLRFSDNHHTNEQ